MVANIRYRINKTTPLSDPEGEMKWVLIRSANVEASERAAGVLPDADAAVFTSEAEANLFSAYLAEIEAAGKERAA